MRDLLGRALSGDDSHRPVEQLVTVGVSPFEWVINASVMARDR